MAAVYRGAGHGEVVAEKAPPTPAEDGENEEPDLVSERACDVRTFGSYMIMGGASYCDDHSCITHRLASKDH